MPGKLIIRFTVEQGIFCGEVSLFELSAEDRHIKRSSAKRYVELSDVYIDKLKRGEGWGATLLTAALAYAQRQGWCVFLRAVPYDQSPLSVAELMQFYRGHGFKSTKRDMREMIWHPKTTKAR